MYLIGKNMQNNNNAPKEGFAGLLQNWRADALSGFLVSLIALPLSLGIAGASGFPPIMGVLTAIVGGLVVAFFAGSALTIKGPAAGLIVIVAGSVEALGKGDAILGWQLTLGIVVIAGILQVIFGLLKVASLANFFPLSAVHGMLAAIGIIIMSKQIHFALGIAPSELAGKDPLELLEMIPQSLMNLNFSIMLIGLISLIILFGMPMLKNKYLKAIPAPLIVLIAGVAMGQIFNLSNPEIANLKPLVNPGTFELSLNNVNFAGFGSETLYTALSYLFLFTVIGSLESVLTGKAIDLLDPWKRKARLNKDLIGVGLGNIISGLLGGLPMISEVARSSANINNGGKTQWANFFHSIFLLLFVVLLVPVIKLVPIAALAAMLIFVGYRLASPKTFFHAFETGKDQLLVFVSTILVTLFTDLLIGIFAGILLEIVIALFNGQKLKYLFKAPVNIELKDNDYYVNIEGACTFSNWISFERKLSLLPSNANVYVNAKNANFLDHTFMENILHIQDERIHEGGSLALIGHEDMKRLSKDCSSGCLRKTKKNKAFQS
jgi:MFS superfamily sulfate permease-like transporter